MPAVSHSPSAPVRTVVYTDGACSGNPGPGGWAWVVPEGKHGSGGEPHTTNQRMELTAALEAIRALDGPLDIVSDSTYLVNCFRDRWWEGWLRRGWVNSQKKPVANRDLWEPIIDAYRNGDITFRWVKGHSGNRWNDEADRLAVTEVERLSRTASPAADPAASPSDGLPPGHRIWVGGHRSQDLGGFVENPITDRVRSKLTHILTAKSEMHPDLNVVTGLTLGAETIGAEIAARLGIPYGVVLAFPDFDAAWPVQTRRHFRDLLAGAAAVVTRQSQTPASRPQMAAAMTRRDGWVRKAVHEAVIVWNGESGPIQKTVEGFRQSLGEENVWVVDPA